MSRRSASKTCTSPSTAQPHRGEVVRNRHLLPAEHLQLGAVGPGELDLLDRVEVLAAQRELLLLAGLEDQRDAVEHPRRVLLVGGLLLVLRREGREEGK